MMKMENNCGNCKNSKGFNQNGVSRCAASYYANVLEDMSCPRFSWKDVIPQFLKDWKPTWHDRTDPEPPTRQLVLMWYAGEPKPKVGFSIGGVWYKSAGSTTPDPDYWTELP
jgi:hypothetical protein